MSKQIEAMKLALEALGRLDGWIALRHGLGLTPQEKEVVTALREALAEQPAQQEPMAWIERDMNCDDFDPDSVTCQKPDISSAGWEWVPLYTAPQAQPAREWVGLTEEEKTELRREHYPLPLLLMEATEAKLKEKNT